MQGKDDKGRFTPKYNEPKSVYSYRLTDYANNYLQAMADEYGCTKTDIIERLIRGEFRRGFTLLAIAEFIESQRGHAGGNQHKPAGELRIETSVHWRKLNEFKRWIEGE